MQGSPVVSMLVVEVLPSGDEVGVVQLSPEARAGLVAGPGAEIRLPPHLERPPARK